jgi:hypothetical protein
MKAKGFTLLMGLIIGVVFTLSFAGGVKRDYVVMLKVDKNTYWKVKEFSESRVLVEVWDEERQTARLVGTLTRMPVGAVLSDGTAPGR